MKDLIFFIRAIFLYPIYQIKNYKRDKYIEERMSQQIARGEEPDEMD
jgi:hypothetical protein